MFALFFRQWSKHQNCHLHRHRGATPHTRIFSLRVLPWTYMSLWSLNWTVKDAIYSSVPLQINYVMQITALFTSHWSCDAYLQKLTRYLSFDWWNFFLTMFFNCSSGCCFSENDFLSLNSYSVLFLLERSMIMLSTLHSGIISIIPSLYWLASKLVSWLTACRTFSMLLLSMVLLWEKISISLCWSSFDSSR